MQVFKSPESQARQPSVAAARKSINDLMTEEVLQGDIDNGQSRISSSKRRKVAKSRIETWAEGEGRDRGFSLCCLRIDQVILKRLMKREASAFVLCSVNDWHLQPVSQSSLSNPNKLILARLAWTGLAWAEPDWSLNQLDGAGVTGARALTLFDRPATGPISQAGKVDATQ